MPQPIDMQTELSRSLMAERIQDAAMRGALVAQQRDLAELKKTQALRETQVDETPEAQSEHIDEDGRRKNPFARRRRESKGNVSVTPRAAERAASEDDDHNLDVSI